MKTSLVLWRIHGLEELVEAYGYRKEWRSLAHAIRQQSVLVFTTGTPLLHRVSFPSSSFTIVFQLGTACHSGFGRRTETGSHANV